MNARVRSKRSAAKRFLRGAARQRILSEARVAALDPSAEERRYTLYRDYLKHEDGLINWRLTWNNTLQGFLFGAWGLFLKGEGAKGDWRIEAAVVLVPVAGFVISFASVFGILAACNAVDALRKKWLYLESRKSATLLPPLPPLAGGGEPNARWDGFTISMTVPLVISAVWATVLFLTLFPPFR